MGITVQWEDWQQLNQEIKINVTNKMYFWIGEKNYSSYEVFYQKYTA